MSASIVYRGQIAKWNAVGGEDKRPLIEAFMQIDAYKDRLRVIDLTFHFFNRCMSDIQPFHEIDDMLCNVSGMITNTL